MDPTHVLVAAALLFGVLLIVYVLRLPEPPRQEITYGPPSGASASASDPTTTIPAATPSTAPASPRPHRLREILALPWLGDRIGLAIGFVFPVVLIFVTLGEHIDGARFETPIVYGVVGAWNLLFTRLTRIRLVTPLIPIPLSFASLALASVCLVAALAGGS